MSAEVLLLFGDATYNSEVLFSYTRPERGEPTLMCLLALLYRFSEDAPVIVGANREEFFDRGETPPRLFDSPHPFVAGTDPRAGGTWLGVNQHGLLVAVTNRRKAPVSNPRSRGLLVRDLLALPNALQAVQVATAELETGSYNGCNIICVDSDRAVVLHGGDWLRVRYLPPGIHVITNGEVNDGSDPRIAHVSSWLKEEPGRSCHAYMARLKEVCSHSAPDHPPICFRTEERGTVSSTIIALKGAERVSLRSSHYLHAMGPPDRTEYLDYSELLRHLEGPS